MGISCPGRRVSALLIAPWGGLGEGSVMEQMAPRIGIEPGTGLVGRFGDTVVLIRRGGPAAADADRSAGELLELAAAVASDRQLPATVIAARLASWVIGHMSEDVTAFGIVVPVQ